MKKVKQKLAQELEKILEIEVKTQDIERPDPEHGDFAYPMMKAASEKGRNPRQLAEESAGELEEIDIVEKTEIAGPGYINFHLDRKTYTETVLETLEGDRFGVKEHNGKMLVEFSAPNLAKPMHIGHVRNNCIGDSLQRIMRFVGYDVTSENYIGDWGTKHGQVIYAYKKWGSEEEFEENPMEHMYELYVKLHDEADEEDQEKAREWSKKIEEGDDEAVELWEMFREATIEHNEKEYQRMDIEFDRVTGESVVAEKAEEMIEEGIEKEVFKEDDDGSVYVKFDSEKYPSTVIKRSDGSTLYLSRDVANIKKREDEGFDYNLYIVGSEQDLHFQQLFEIAKRFDITDIENEHISYGMLDFEEGTMSSSKGNIIRLTEILDRAAEKAAEIEDRDVSNAEEVGQAAVKYANLAVSRKKNIEFDWDRALSFEGDSGPYLQYSNTRAKSILKKTDKDGQLRGTPTEEEYSLVKKLAEFPEQAEEAAEQREPAKIANYLSTLCEEFNSFYHECPVLDADPETKDRRIKIVKEFERVTSKGLDLLGIQDLDQM